MKFVIFTLLFVGISFAQEENDLLNIDNLTNSIDGILGPSLDSLTSDPVGAVTNVAVIVPNLIYVADTLRDVTSAKRDMADYITNAADKQALYNKLSPNLGDLNAALQALAQAATNLTDAILADTDEDGNIDLTNLGDVNAGIKDIGDQEVATTDALRSLMNGGTSTESAEVTDVGSSLDSISVEKDKLTDAAASLRGVSGAVFGAAVDVSGVTEELDNTSDGLNYLVDAVENFLADLESNSADDLKTVVQGLRALGQTEANLATAVRGLTEL